MRRPKFINVNAGLSPQDPSYSFDYDEEEDYESYLEAMEDRELCEREDFN